MHQSTRSLNLAAAIGIDTVETSILTTGEWNAICVLRYDRAPARRGGLMRVHQEDFAQANSLPPGRKYERGSLPGLALEQLLKTRFRISPTLLDPLVDQVIFNILVANTDAHAKNYRLLLPIGGGAIMAPLYDVSTVLPWANQQAGIRGIHDHTQISPESSESRVIWHLVILVIRPGLPSMDVWRLSGRPLLSIRIRAL